MAAPCTDHLFLTGQRGVGKSTLLRCLLEGKRPGGFLTLRVEGVFDRPSIHLLRAASAERPAPENLVCFCGEQRPERFDLLGVAAKSRYAAFCSRRTALFCAGWRRIRVCGWSR